jgi:hypothetical protein
MSPQRLKATVNQNEALELADGIEITQHTPTDGVDIRRRDYPVFNGGPVVIPDNSLAPVAEALIDESPRDPAVWVEMMLPRLSEEQKAGLVKSLIDEVVGKERADDEV